MNANLIFKWLKDPRFKPEATEIEETVFLPVEVSTEDMALAPSLSDDRLVQKQNPGNNAGVSPVMSKLRNPKEWRGYFSARWPFRNKEDIEHLLGSLHKAGLPI